MTWMKYQQALSPEVKNDLHEKPACGGDIGGRDWRRVSVRQRKAVAALSSVVDHAGECHHWATSDAHELCRCGAPDDPPRGIWNCCSLWGAGLRSAGRGDAGMLSIGRSLRPDLYGLPLAISNSGGRRQSFQTAMDVGQLAMRKARLRSIAAVRVW